MAISTAMNTALSGLNASQSMIDVAGNNIANAGTIGFKASDVVFSTQLYQTLSAGTAPTDNLGGSNPSQVGLGVQIGAIRTNYNAGVFDVTGVDSDAAINGDGFFIVRDVDGSTKYTRAGSFTVNADNELVTITGQRVLGYTVDENFQLVTGELTPLSVPLGTEAEAEASTEVTLQGNLSPTAQAAISAEVLQSDVLIDGTVEAPPSLAPGDVNATVAPSVVATVAVGLDATPPDLTGPPAAAAADSNSATGVLAPGGYSYKFVFVDNNGAEGVPSATLAATVNPGSDTLTLSNLPTPATGSGFSGLNVYRSASGAPGTFELAGPTVPAGATTFVDTGTQTSPGVFLDEGPFYTPTSPPAQALVNYQVTFVDSNGVESPPAVIPGIVSLNGTPKKIVLDNLPAAPNASYTKRIYRSTVVSGGVPAGPYQQVGGDLAWNEANFVDDGTTGAQLDDSTLDIGNYTYYLTYFNSGTGEESRPTAPLGPEPVSQPGQRIRLDNLPVPSGVSGFDSVRIYRTLSDDPSDIRLVSTQPAGATFYVDSSPDAAIAGAIPLDPYGPSVDFTLPVVDTLRRTSTGQFEPLMGEGTLRFTGSKGGFSTQPQELEITSTTTIQELMNFISGSLGVLDTSPDPTTPLEGVPGGTLSGGRIQLTANRGEANAIAIPPGSFELDNGTLTERVDLLFGSIQDAVGAGDTTEVFAYDSLGVPIRLRVRTSLISTDGEVSRFRWFADTPNNDPLSGYQTNVGTGIIEFDGQGRFISSTNSIVSIDRDNIPSSSPLQLEVDFSHLTALSTPTTNWVAQTDGSPAGVLTSFRINGNGMIQGQFDNGVNRDLGQFQLARFSNPGGLEQVGDNLFQTGFNTGEAFIGAPGDIGLGEITSGSLELSNADVGQSLVDLILASTLYRSNTRVINTGQQMLDELLNLRR